MARASILKLRLDWSEMDLFGHINNVAYFKYLQAGRVHYWETIGLNALHRQEGLGPILARTHCDFRQPLHFPGEISVHTRLKNLGNSSFVLEHEIRNETDELAALGEDVVVVYDFNRMETLAIPSVIRERMEAKGE